MRLGQMVVGGHLDRYVLRLFAASFLVAFLMVVGIFFVLDLTSHLEEFLSEGEDGTTPPRSLVLRYYLLHLPFIYLQVAPLVTLLAGLFSVSRLMRDREVIAALSGGVSVHRMLTPIFFGGALLGLGMFALREWATESIGNERDRIYDYLVERRPEPIAVNLTIKDKTGTFVRLGEFRPGTLADPTARVRDVRAILRTSDHWTRILAPSGEYRSDRQPNGWYLEGGRREDVIGENLSKKDIDYLAEVHFTPEDVFVAWKARERPLELSFRETVSMSQRDPDNTQYKTLLQYHLSFPLANLVLLSIGVPFLVRFRRGRGSQGVMAGFLCCVFFFGFDFLSRSMGMGGQMGPMMASWSPVVIFGSLGVVLFASMRT